VLVDKWGDVIDLEIVSTRPTGFGFGKAATRSVREWKFQPASFGGESVATRSSIIVEFDLTD